MVHSKAYWEKRQIVLFNKQDKNDDKLVAKMSKEYDRVAKNLEKEVATYYARYSKGDVVEYRQMVQQLTDSERTLLYQNYDAFMNKHPDLRHLMPVRQSIYQLNRLEGLQLSAQQQLLELGAIEQEEFDKTLTKAYENGYLSSMKGLDNTQAFFRVDPLVMQATLDSKWLDGNNYSDRIWDNKTKLINTLNNEIRDGLIRGDSYNSMIKTLRHRTDVGLSDATRLVRTESAYILNEANAQAFQKAGILEYEISAVMDARTSPTCRTLDGERFNFKDRVVGATAPPFHPWCRSTMIPVENVLTNTSSSSVDGYEIMDKTNMRQSVGDDRYDQFVNALNNITDERTKQLYSHYGDRIEYEKIINANGVSSAHRNVVKLHVRDFADRLGKPALQTVFHENGHAFDNIALEVLTGEKTYVVGKKKIKGRKGKMVEVDNIVSHASSLPQYNLKETIKRDFWQYLNGDLPMYEDIGPKPRKKVDKVIWEEETSRIYNESRKNREAFLSKYKVLAKENLETYGALSDIAEGTGYIGENKPLGTGHGKNYWKRDGALETEFFAHVSESIAVNPESYQVLQEVFPNSIGVWEQIVDDIIKGAG